MKTNFVEELRWRGMIQDIMPGTEELLTKEMVKGYILTFRCIFHYQKQRIIE